MTTTARALRARTLAAVAATALLTAGLGGCSVINSITGDVERDESGQVVEGNDSADVFSIVVGDCLNDASVAEEVNSLPIVPCTEPHDSEVYHAFDLTTAELPTDVELETAILDGCYPEFETFIGLSYDDSMYYIGYYSPSVESWADGDREILCTVYDEAGQTTGSLEAIGR